MDKRDAEGFRLAPDGNPFAILIESGAHAPDLVPMAELLVEHFKQVGIKAALKKIDASLWGQRAAANELQGSVIWDVQPMWRDGTWIDYIPWSVWGQRWQVWYNTNGKEGEEPPEAVRQLYKIHQGRIQAVPASPEDKKLTEEMYKVHYDNIFIFPAAEKVRYALIANARLGNIPIGGQAIGADNSGEQFFFKE